MIHEIGYLCSCDGLCDEIGPLRRFNGDDVSCPVDRADLLARFQVREDGVILSGAAAFAAVWRAAPLLRPLSLAARWPWVLALLERDYVVFLRVRLTLQRIAVLGFA